MIYQGETAEEYRLRRKADVWPRKVWVWGPVKVGDARYLLWQYAWRTGTLFCQRSLIHETEEQALDSLIDLFESRYALDLWPILQVEAEAYADSLRNRLKELTNDHVPHVRDDRPSEV